MRCLLAHATYTAHFLSAKTSNNEITQRETARIQAITGESGECMQTEKYVHPFFDPSTEAEIRKNKINTTERMLKSVNVMPHYI